MKPQEIKLVAVENAHKGPELTDAAGEARRAIESFEPEQSVAIAVGSRGVDRLAEIVKALVDHVRARGADPFIVPAMGSHGGATADGQRLLLEKLGISAAAMGAPVRSATETVELPPTASGLRLRFDRTAFEADQLVVVNRVKPHTRFGGPIQSGLCKMALVGLGNRAGAELIHKEAMERSFAEIVDDAFGVLAGETPLSFGLALVENGRKKLAALRAVSAADFKAADRELLVVAKEWIARLPFERIDLLIVDRIGKEISGTGMDTNVIGRKNAHASPHVVRILVRGLSGASRGNATGIGFADAVTRPCADRIDHKATALNCFTALRPEGARLPAVFENDCEALGALLPTTGRPSAESVRLVRIASTASLERLEVSTALLDELKTAEGVRPLGPPRNLSFDGNGFLEEFPF